MGRINVDDLRPGMVLASDLFGPNGRFLLPRGSALEERSLRVLKMWGVMDADVEGVSAEQAEAAREQGFAPEILAESKAVVLELFRLQDMSHEAVRELFGLSVSLVARRLAAGLPVRRPAAPIDEGRVPSRPCPPQDLLSAEVQLASLPDVFVRINEVLNNPRSSSAHVADIIGKDASLSAKLLKLVNSPFYGFPAKIETLTRAVTIVGSRQLTMLALGVSVITIFKDIPPGVMDMRAFWKHSLACGLVARLLAGLLNDASEERHFVAGLLHDLGRLVVFKNAPELGRRIVVQAARDGTSMREAEQEVMGFDHARIGERLMRGWKLPPALELAVRFHHEPQRVQTSRDAAVVHAADVIAHAMLCGSGAASVIPPLVPAAWERLGLSRGALGQVAAQLERQVEEIFKAFIIDGEQARP